MELINWFFKFKKKKLTDFDINSEDIVRSKKIFFCLFTRYGDTIIDIVVIKEFIEEYPNKDYLILCPKQMKPYVNEIIPNIRCISINKRNLIEILKIDLLLKKWSPDIGFNPWSNGFESWYFLSYCKKYKLYKNFLKPEIINHYEIVRRYLNLEEKNWKINKLLFKFNFKKILICPESTNSNRSITDDQLDMIIKNIKSESSNAKITIASISLDFFKENTTSFIFKKNEASSQSFIRLLKDCELIICADSAPLHIANALKKNVIAVFNSTDPSNVLNSGDALSFFN